MKVNFILPFKRMSGGIRVVFIYANYLTEQGYDVCCYLPMISYKGINQNVFFRVKASISNTFKKENWFDCKFLVNVVPLINDVFIRNADVTIATAWQTAYDVKKLSVAKGKKYYLVQDYEIFNGIVEDVEGSYSLGIPMITVSNALKEKLLKFSNDVTVIYNGLYDYEYIQGSKKESKKFTIMLMFHEAEHKGTLEGLKVVKSLEKKYKNIQIIVFGRKITSDLPSNYVISENPKRYDLIKLYQMADIYLFTSYIEAWGLPIVEAMANKCAVIGRRIGALKELYNGNNAIIVNNISDMEKAVEILYEDSILLNKIQCEGYTTVSDLNWSEAGKKLEMKLKDKISSEFL